MSRYEVGVRTTITTASVPIASLRAISDAVWLREVHLWYVTAPTTSGGLGLTRSTALGTGALTGVLGFPTNPSDAAGTAEAVTAWATAAPTFTAGAFFRRWFSGAAAIGTGYMWTFEPPGLYIPGGAAANSEIVLVNLQATAAGTLDLTWVLDES
jgi:hypothetical protein